LVNEYNKIKKFLKYRNRTKQLIAIFVIGVFLAASTLVYIGANGSKDVVGTLSDGSLTLSNDSSDVTIAPYEESSTELPAYTYKVTPTSVLDASGKTVYTGTATACIQWANDKTPSGGTVSLAAGTFSITGKIWIDKNLVGAGTSTKLVAAKNLGTDTMVQVAKRDFSALSKITLSNFEVDGKGATYTSGIYGGIELVRCTYCTLSNIYVHHFPKSHGIEFQASSYNTVSNCRISNIGYGNQYGSGICSGSQIAGVSSTYNKIDGCTITGCSMAGVDWEPGNNNIVSNTVIKSLTSWSGRTTGMTVWNKGGYANSNNNQFINVQVDDDDTNLISIGTTGTVVKGCTFTGAKSSGIYTSGCSGWTISDNKVITKGGHGVYTWNSNSMKVTGNYVEDGSGAKKGRGIWITSDSTHTSSGNTISSNKVVNCLYGILFGAKTVSSTVTNNVVTGCPTEYKITSGNTVSNNS